MKEKNIHITLKKLGLGYTSGTILWNRHPKQEIPISSISEINIEQIQEPWYVKLFLRAFISRGATSMDDGTSYHSEVKYELNIYLKDNTVLISKHKNIDVISSFSAIRHLNKLINQETK